MKLAFPAAEADAISTNVADAASDARPSAQASAEGRIDILSSNSNSNCDPRSCQNAEQPSHDPDGAREEDQGRPRLPSPATAAWTHHPPVTGEDGSIWSLPRYRLDLMDCNDALDDAHTDTVTMEGMLTKEYRELNLGSREIILYNLKTMYLITKSDMKTTILPAATFAFATVLSGPLLTTDSTPTILNIFLRFPKAIIWTWANLWLFNLANQRLPNSILEDSINKPWRAIPSGRLTPFQARQLLLISIPLVVLLSAYLGARDECVALLVLTWIYNDLGAADESFIVRHFCNALGFITFGAGASQVACGFPMHTLNTTAYQWLAVIAAVITCTIQFQDMEDQEGDRERDRRTLPIILGDLKTRFVNAFVIILFSIIAPTFWRLGIAGYLVPVSMGVMIAFRTLLYRTLAGDKQTFKLWCAWLVGLYLLPLLKQKATWVWY